MNQVRFAELADAYGGDLARWPADLRSAGQAWAAAHPAAQEVLNEARDLDTMLSTYVLVPPSADRQRRVVTRLVAERRLSRRLAGWFAALAALAGAGAVGAGATVGAAMVAFAPAPVHPSSIYDQSSFGDFGSADDVSATPGA